MDFTRREKELILDALQAKSNVLRKTMGSARMLDAVVWEKRLHDEWKEVDSIIYRFCKEQT